MHEDGREGEGAFYMLALEGDQIIDARPRPILHALRIMPVIPIWS